VAEVPAFPALVPASQAAAFYGITLRTLSNWEMKGILEPIRIAGRRYYRSADLFKLQENRIWPRIARDLET